VTAVPKQKIKFKIMSAKDILIGFINFIFAILVVFGAIFYFISGDNFVTFRHILESLAPFALLALVFLINFKFWREKAKKKEREGNLDLTLRLTFIDKFKSDVFLFLLPVVSLAIAFIVNRGIGKTDILSASAIFIIAYLWQKWLFSKEKM
jgi:hypothetical protein